MMPKVTEKYIREKKNQILDSALAVCKQKPLFAVTMQDIINETGYSQGAIYRYYQDIDDVLIAVLNRFFALIDFRQEAESIFERNDRPEGIIKNIFHCLAQYMSEANLEYFKILLEIDMIYAAYPERALKFRNSLTIQDCYSIILDNCFLFIGRQTESGYFTPLIPLQDIISFAVSSYDGIMRNVTMLKCYHLDKSLPLYTKYDEKVLLDTLCNTILYLLGVAKCTLT